MTDREVMQVALEALENTSPLGFFNMESDKKFFAAITSLRARLAEPEPEPVAWALSHSLGIEFSSRYPMQQSKEVAGQMARQHMGAVTVTPLYTAPPTRRPLTDKEIDGMWREATIKPALTSSELVRTFARAIEAAYGIKEER